MSDRRHFFTIQEISNRLDIPKPTLRFWEKELDGIIAPIRTPGGQRRYNARHISVIQEIHNLRKDGMSINDIKIKLSPGREEKSAYSVPSPIDSLAEQVSELVKKEIKRFFETEFSNS